MSNENFPLGEVISALRSEIKEAMENGKGQDVQFDLGSIELELTLTVKAEGGSEGKISFHVLGAGAEIGGKGKIAKEQVQKVKFTITPFRASDSNSGMAFDVSSQKTIVLEVDRPPSETVA